MKPEDVPDELVKLACIGYWPSGKDEPETAVFAYGNEMRKVLAAVLPAHEAMVRAKVAAEIESVADRTEQSSPRTVFAHVSGLRKAAEIARGGA